MIDDMITHVRDDIEIIEELQQAEALFQVSAEVLGGLQKAFEHHDEQSEKVWK